MREIKFRAWDKAYKAMCHADNGVQYVADWLQTPEVFAVMEYTGLKDKHGVEICEGDILHTEHPDDDSVGAVEFISGAFQRTRDPIPRYPKLKYADIWPNQCQVIGNIYENPELLESAS